MRRILTGLVVFGAVIAHSEAITISLDYSHDSNNIFLNNPTAKATLEKVAQDLSAALTAEGITLNAINGSEYRAYSDNFESLSTITWRLKLNDPSNLPATFSLANFTAPQDTVTIYVGGASSVPGSDALGQGSPATADYDLGINYFEFSEIQQAILRAAGYSSGTLLRGGGPTITEYNDVAKLDEGDVSYTLDVGAIAGSLTFAISANWQFDYASPVGDAQFDFYTVALHEMIHGLGLGTSKTWKSEVSGANWSGTNVSTLMGTGMGMVNETLNGKPDGVHIAAGVMSKTLEGDVDQEAVMTPTLKPGERRKLTKLDIAFIKDLGFGAAGAAPTPLPTPVPATPTPTPTATPEPTPVSAVPEPPIINGKSKITTTKSSIKLGGALLSEGAVVQYKIGKGPYIKAKGTASWKIKVKLKPGKNIITIVSINPVTGEMSRPKKIVITKI